MAAPDPKSRLTSAIRGWVHFDNLVESLNHQAINARELRSKHETDALTLLKQMGLTHTHIQVADAQLQFASRREVGGLSWTYLEQQLPLWAAHTGVSAEQAKSLLTWLQTHREFKEKEYLKKTSRAKAPE